jgi:hypothetical protein
MGRRSHEEVDIADGLSPKPLGRPYEKGRSGNHAGRGGEDRGGGRHLCRRSMPPLSAIDASDFGGRLQELEDASKARAAACTAEAGSLWLYTR